MSRLVARGLIALGAVAAGVIAWRYLPRQSRRGPGSTVGDWMAERMMRQMGRMMARLPDNAPPKLVMTILPKLQAQNEQIVALLREQNDLLRQQRTAPR